MFFNTLGTSYISIALTAARQADPHAKLYINDFNIEGPGLKATAMMNLVTTLQSQKVPIDGIGFQCHFIVGEVPAGFQQNLQAFTALGVEVAITELDVRFAALPPDEEGLEQQRRDFETIVRACREVEGCIGITVWDWTDKVRIERSRFDSSGAGARGRLRFLF